MKCDSIDPDTFLELIADRSILFHEYNQAYVPIDYPTLNTLVESYHTQIETGNYPEEIIHQVLDQALVPSRIHYDDYKTWQENIKELKDAKIQREQQLSRMNELPAPFTIPITPLDNTADLTEFEHQLADLFLAYLKACEAAYVKWIKKSDWVHTPWCAAIHSLFTYLSTVHPSIPGLSALVFFHLFTQKAQKLSNGSLSTYRFKAIPKRKNLLEAPSKRQPRERLRIQFNILLYDQLLELFLIYEHPDWSKEEKEQYRQDAKFIFYRYSRYDRYWHYNLGSFEEKPSIHFNYNENYLDGVDFFGNLLRYHIDYCIPHNLQ